MRWFRREAPRGITLPFPPDRLAALCTFIIPGSIVGALRLRHEAFALGAADGASYFTALLAPTDADDTATVNLRLAVRSYKTFPPLELPVHLQGE